MHPTVIKYQLRRTDRLAWTLGYVVRNPFIWGFVLLLTGLRCWTLFRDGLAQSIPRLILHGTLTAACLFIAYATCVTLLILIVRSAGIGLEVTLELTPEGVRASSSLGSQELRWHAFRRIRRSRAHTFLCISNSQALIIPDRALPDPQVRESFIAECRTRMAAAGGAA